MTIYYGKSNVNVVFLTKYLIILYLPFRLKEALYSFSGISEGPVSLSLHFGAIIK